MPDRPVRKASRAFVSLLLTAMAVACATARAQTAPEFTTQPDNAIVSLGENATFTVVADGVPTPTYQWQVSADNGGNWTNLIDGDSNITDGANASGSATANLTIGNVTEAMEGDEFQCIASNGTASVTSNAVTLIVNAFAPEITTQPANVSVLQGTSTSFAVVATGAPAPTYQWLRATSATGKFGNVTGANYTGEKTSNLTISNITSTMNGYRFEVIVTNTLGNVTSVVANLTVESAPAYAENPTNVTVNSGVTAPFSVAEFQGIPAPSIQWQVSVDDGNTWSNLTNGVNVTTGANITGATNATLMIGNTSVALSGLEYQAIAYNPAGSYTGGSATLTVDPPLPPVIHLQPQSATVSDGTFITLSVGAANPIAGGLTYQWYLGSDPIIGATNASYAIPSATSLNAGNYTVQVSNASSTVTSNVSVLLVKPIIGRQPAAVSISAGKTATFTVSVPDAGVMYQWEKNGVALVNGGNISGATGPTLTITGVTSANVGAYRVVISDSSGFSVTSAAVTLAITSPPTITTQPKAQTVAANVNVTFKVVAQGSAPLTYQWQRNGANLVNGKSVKGATTATLTLSKVSTSNSGTYRVTVKNPIGKILSASVKLTVK
jgi:hypothetical protein